MRTDNQAAKGKAFGICMTILVAVIAALIWLNCTVKRGPEPDRVIPMANAGIERTGAGYSGIYAR